MIDKRKSLCYISLYLLPIILSFFDGDGEKSVVWKSPIIKGLKKLRNSSTGGDNARYYE